MQLYMATMQTVAGRQQVMRFHEGFVLKCCAQILFLTFAILNKIHIGLFLLVCKLETY